MRSLHELCHFHSTERCGEASNGELKRWIQNGAVVMNGEKKKWDEEVNFPVNSLVIFPKGKRRTTLI